MASSPPHPIAAPLYDRGSPTESDRGALSRALLFVLGPIAAAFVQLLVRRVSVGVFRASRDGRLLEVNPALVRMLGYACDSELRALDLHRDVFADAVENERLRARLARRPIERLTTRWRRKDGTCIAVRLSMRELQDDGSGMVFYDGIVDDVTDRIRQQELLRRTERMACLGATLAGVAHELNNPLAAILGFAQLLMKQEVDRDARLALETIDHEASRAGRIVRDLLTLVRKRDAERRVRSSLNDIVAYIAGTRRYALETHGITCDTDLDPRLPNVVGDRTQLEQVVLNLLNNAEQAIRAVREEGGRIRIRTWADGSTAVLEVVSRKTGARETLAAPWRDLARVYRRLEARGVPVTVRDTRGREIDGACGQLAAAE